MQPELNAAEMARYQRQIRIDGFGVEAQRRLKTSSVMISRVGGVGGTAAINMALAGVGRLTLVHGGKVVPEYLNRWVWAGPDDVGRPCTDVISAHIRRINPHVEVQTVSDYVSEQNVADLVSKSDLVIDGAPLFEERYLMHREAVRQKKPIVLGAMYSTEGYVTTYLPDGQTPCLKCIYPSKPEYWTHIEVFPAIGPGPIMLGSMAAMEAIKVLTGFGEPLKGVLWLLDLQTSIVKQLKVNRRDNCEVCG